MCQTEPDNIPTNPDPEPLDAQTLVGAYLAGAFPMAEPETGEVLWYSPDPRAILPIAEEHLPHRFHVRRSLAKRLRQTELRLTQDAAFEQVIDGCAQPRPGEPETWISDGLTQLYIELHHNNLAHSVEVWREDQLVGGIYGVALGGAFFGESMFSREPYASQIALVGLVERLRIFGYSLFDVQFVNPHLEQFGVIELPRAEYMKRLETATSQRVRWGLSSG